MKNNKLILALGAAIVLSLGACSTHETAPSSAPASIGTHGGSDTGGPMQKNVGKGPQAGMNSTGSSMGQ